MTIFREFLPLYCIFQKTNLISFSYLPKPSNWQRMSEIDFSTVATFLEFSLIFTDITLNALTKKGVKFCWSESYTDAFNPLKHAFISAPVLAFPNFDEQFLLYVDASSTGIGFGLAQVQDGREVVIAHNGRGLNQAERNYTTTEREALALVEGMKKFQPYLHDRKFVV